MNNLNEVFARGILFAVSIIGVMLAAQLWMIGGRPGGRWWKRFVCPVFFCTFIIIFSMFRKTFNEWYLIAYPVYLIAHSVLSYGAEKLKDKISKRFMWAIGFSICDLVFVLISHAWLIYLAQISISVIASVIFGVFNPFKDAETEEPQIFFSSKFLVPYLL